MARVEGFNLGAQPEVYEDEPPARVDEQVARMRVRVEEAHVEQLRQEARHARRDQPIDDLRRRFGELLSLDPFCGEHLSTRDTPIGLGDVHFAAEARHELGLEALEVGRLVPIVQLQVRRASKRVQQIDIEGVAVRRTEDAGQHLLLEPLDAEHVVAKEEEVEGDGADHVRPLHLERHLLPTVA